MTIGHLHLLVYRAYYSSLAGGGRTSLMEKEDTVPKKCVSPNNAIFVKL